MFNQLPNEIKLHTLSFLNKRDLGALAQTSKGNHHLSNDPSLWKERLKQDFNCNVPEQVDPRKYYQRLATESKILLPFIATKCLIDSYQAFYSHNEERFMLWRTRLYSDPKSAIKILNEMKEIYVDSDIKYNNHFDSAQETLKNFLATQSPPHHNASYSCMNLFYNVDPGSFANNVLEDENDENHKKFISTVKEIVMVSGQPWTHDGIYHLVIYMQEQQNKAFCLLQSLCQAKAVNLLKIIIENHPHLVFCDLTMAYDISLLHNVIMYIGDPNLVKYLIDKSTPINICETVTCIGSNSDNIQCPTPLHAVLSQLISLNSSIDHSEKIIELLLQNEADIDSKIHDVFGSPLATAKELCVKHQHDMKLPQKVRNILDRVANWSSNHSLAEVSTLEEQIERRFRC